MASFQKTKSKELLTHAENGLALEKDTEISKEPTNEGKHDREKR